MAEEEEQTETSEKTPLQCAEEAVNDLYDFRDHYFEKFSISKSHLKDEDVKKKMEECLELLSSKKGLSKNKVSLRNLSMVLRQIPGIPPLEKLEIVKESVEKAKDAVHMDITDGSSWANLGNAYLSLFFAEGQNPKTLKQAMSAYNQAVRDPVAKNNPDLHFNRAIAYKYQEDYQEALEGFSTAKALDCDWLGPVEQETRLLDFLTQLTMLQSSHGKMKAKKLINLSKSIKESDLGPYQGGNYTADNGRTVELKKKMFKELQPGVNKHTVIVGKVVCTISHVDPIPL
ncbi:tetratricopeptide repeat protein 5 [Octopus bimaculoides]|nr:tetratricopeptide repeat protein 5 [Octopus bimaculoides]